MKAYGEDVGKWMMKNAGMNVGDYESVYTLAEGELFFALNTEAPDTTVAALQKSLDKLKTKDKLMYQQILGKYLK